MRRIIDQTTQKIKELLQWIWKECRDWRTAVILVCVMAAVYSPVWGGYLLHALFGWSAGSVIASTCLLFWAGPFTPFFPLCIAITMALKGRMGGSKERTALKRRLFRHRQWFTVSLYRTRCPGRLELSD